jgi:hypothetical protein
VADFATRAELEAYLHMPTNASNATLAALATAGASEAIRKVAGWSIDAGTTSMYVRGTGLPWIVLPIRHVTAVTAVTPYVDGSAGSAVAGTAYRLRGSDILEATSDRVWIPGLEYRVDAAYGYATPPADLKLVCLAAAGRFYLQTGVASESAGGVSTTYAKSDVDLTDDERRLVARYGLRSLA